MLVFEKLVLDDELEEKLKFEVLLVLDEFVLLIFDEEFVEELFELDELVLLVEEEELA